MKLTRWAIAMCLVSGTVYAANSSNPTPVTTNKDDSPPRVQSGKVFASTDVDHPPALGPADAKVVVLVFSDFQCPVCRRSADATDQIAEEFPGDVRVEFWQHPLTTHANAENAAVASLAAQRQGMFWEYHDELFRNQAAIDPDSLARYAEQLGMDAERFKSDYADPALRARAQREAATAETFGAKNTPAFMVNGKLKTGWGSWYGFRTDVERELAEAKKLEEQGTAGASVAESRAATLLANDELFRVYRDQVLRPAPDVSQSTGKPKKEKKKKKHEAE
jgi:protein-disulfide isomerase